MIPRSPLRPHFGDKYLVYTSYPKGFPVLEMSEDTAEKVLKRVNPGVAISRDRYVFGRTKWNDERVGCVVYPLNQDDSRTIDGVLNDPVMDNFQKDAKINAMMPGLIERDTGEFHVYDLSLNDIVQHPNVAESDDSAEAVVPASALPSVPQVVLPNVPPSLYKPLPLPRLIPKLAPARPMVPHPLPPSLLNPPASQPVNVALSPQGYPLPSFTPPPTPPVPAPLMQWQWPPPPAPNFWASQAKAPPFPKAPSRVSFAPSPS